MTTDNPKQVSVALDGWSENVTFTEIILSLLFLIPMIHEGRHVSAAEAILIFSRHWAEIRAPLINFPKVGTSVCALLDDKEYIALVDCTICGFFRYFRSNKPEGGRTTARTNLTKNEFL